PPRPTACRTADQVQIRDQRQNRKRSWPDHPELAFRPRLRSDRISDPIPRNARAGAGFEVSWATQSTAGQAMPSVRRLTAILAADVAGYSRLMGTDEEGTHDRLRAHLRELVDPNIAECRGPLRIQNL